MVFKVRFCFMAVDEVAYTEGNPYHAKSYHSNLPHGLSLAQKAFATIIYIITISDFGLSVA
jgi:hypothetical protein